MRVVPSAQRPGGPRGAREAPQSTGGITQDRPSPGQRLNKVAMCRYSMGLHGAVSLCSLDRSIVTQGAAGKILGQRKGRHDGAPCVL
jgi:hypothetical protein